MFANEQYKFVNAILLSNNIYKKYPHNNISLWCFVSLFNITLMYSNTKDREKIITNRDNILLDICANFSPAAAAPAIPAIKITL